MKRLVIIITGLALTGCSGEQEDIQTWMRQQERGMSGSVKPLPEIKPFPPVKYEVADAKDPFAVSRLEPEAKASKRGGPDMDRRREPLEAYPLETLQLVGVIRQDGRVHALVRVDKTLHQVRVGNYLGQNFGLVMGISDTEVTVKELVEDLNGDWVDRTSTLLLQEQQEAKK